MTAYECTSNEATTNPEDAVSPSADSADDSGFTPAEIIIGVILLAILSTGVVAQALKLRQQAQDSAAQTTLRSAVVAAQSVYAQPLPSGQNNFAAKRASATQITDTTTNGEAEEYAVAALSAQEPNIQFKVYTDLVIAANNTGKVQSMIPATSTVWVQMNYEAQKLTTDISTISNNPQGFVVTDGLISSIDQPVNIRPGEMIRMGIVGASGSSFCVILVVDSSTGVVSGKGFQSVSEASTLAGYGADCGAADERVPADAFKEMPGTLGTDPELVSPVDIVTSGTTNFYGGNREKA